jgi:tol-pal system protein YbgF
LTNKVLHLYFRESSLGGVFVKRDPKFGLGLALFAVGLTSCAPLGAVTSIVTTTLAGASYVKSQTVERTFAAPMPEVQQACRQALETMAFTITEERPHKNEYRIIAVAPGDYEIKITIVPITSNATRVSVNADSLPERDQATGREIIEQMASALASSRPVLASSTVPKEEVSQVSIDLGPPVIPVLATVRPALPAAPTEASPRPPDAPQTPPSWLHSGQQPPPITSMRVERQDDATRLEQLYETGIRAYVAGDFPRAAEHFRRYLAAHPLNGHTPTALYWLGESLYSQREYADAVLQFETILREYPGSPEVPRALFRGAHAYRKLGDVHRAEALLQMLITLHPTSREAHLVKTAMQGE